MPIATASVPTVNAAKYMQQLCKHWGHKLEVELSEQRGVVKFPVAVATFEPRPEALKVTIEGEEGEAVERMKGVVASHLDRFAFREAPLKFDWSAPQDGRRGWIQRRPTTMKGDELRAIQAPLKERYRGDAKAGLVTLKANGALDSEGIACKVDTGRALAVAGLHPATGGSGAELCSGDMLLEALVACAGVTMKAVATSLGIALRSGKVAAEGDLDFRGTLGVDKQAPVGFSDIRLKFELDTDAPQDQIDTLLKLTERYCVVLQTLRHSPKTEATIARA
jgi:uncharacterized OsmC-like protein